MYSLDEFPVLYILAYAPHEYKSHIFVNRGRIELIKAEDRVFLDTLRLYLVIRNMGDVANLLGIHSNSVKYRLGKAMKLLGYQEEAVIGDLIGIKLLIRLELIVIEN